MIRLLSPGDPEQRTGGYLYNKHLVSALQSKGVPAQIQALRWPWASGAGPHLSFPEPVLVDGLMWMDLPSISRAVVLVHSFAAWEPGAPEGTLERELEALRRAEALVCTGGPVHRLLTLAGLDSSLALPGVEVRLGPKPNGPVHLLCAATLTARKGHARLLEALSGLEGWTLDLVGSTQREPQTAARIRGLIGALGLEDRVRILGEQADMTPHYHRAHALVHAAHHEAFGMVLAEAVAHGRPVLSTPAGALEVLPVGAALELGDLRVGLAAYLGDAALRERMWVAAQGAELPTWAQAADTVMEVLDGL
ncbi:MAG: glycosyltransferase [Myxococcota bacterium]|nr:glycosyltransferase [Myxococcota bacterium]